VSIHTIAETYFIPAQLILAMLGMGATLTMQEFIDVLKDPRGLSLGLALQLIFVPALALLFIYGFSLSPGWAVGLLLIAVVPGGAFSNLLTYIGKGNAALSVSLTTASNILCVFTIPLLLDLVVADFMPADFEVPTERIVKEIIGYLLVPLVVGMVILRARPDLAGPIAQWSIRGSLVLLATIVVSSLGSGRIKVAEYGWGPPLRLILFGILLSRLSTLLCRLFGRYDDDTTAIAIEVVVRNIAVALLLVHFFFPGHPAQAHVLYSCLFYAGAAFFIGLPIALDNRRGRSAAWPLAPRPRPRPAE